MDFESRLRVAIDEFTKEILLAVSGCTLQEILELTSSDTVVDVPVRKKRKYTKRKTASKAKTVVEEKSVSPDSGSEDTAPVIDSEQPQVKDSATFSTVEGKASETSSEQPQVKEKAFEETMGSFDLQDVSKEDAVAEESRVEDGSTSTVEEKTVENDSDDNF